MRFTGKTALITGGGGVIGRATARLLHKEGANVVLVDHAPAALAPVAAELGEAHVLTITADVTRADDCRAYAGKASEAPRARRACLLGHMAMQESCRAERFRRNCPLNSAVRGQAGL